MSLPEFHADLDHIPDSGELFPDPIGSDPWVAFHGTSGINTVAIEREGLRCGEGLVSQAELRAIAETYEWMRWYGTDPGGYAVLKPWSIEHDHRHGANPVFFHHDSLRVLTFALQDFAGGEKVRAARRAMSDLHQYLDNADIRDEHAVDMSKRIHPSIRALTVHEREKSFSNLSSAVKAELLRDLDWRPIDLGELGRRVCCLDPLLKRCTQPHDAHPFGVVYAVRFRASDLSTMQYSSSMGIQVFSSIAPDRIIGKAILTLETERKWEHRIATLRSPKQLERILNPRPDGLIASLTAKEPSSQLFPTANRQSIGSLE